MIAPPHLTRSPSWPPDWACWGVTAANGPPDCNSRGIVAQALNANRINSKKIRNTERPFRKVTRGCGHEHVTASANCYCAAALTNKR